MNFIVEGEGFTAIARNIMLSDMPAKAWRLITEGLIGASQVDKQARALLDGDMKLAGSTDKGGLYFEKENAKAYKETLRYVYAGRVRVGGSWWRPRAIVTDFGPGDMAYATERNRELLTPMSEHEAGLPRMRAVYRGRVAYYAKEGERVLEATVDGKRRFVIFEPASELPFWWPEKHYMTEAMTEFVAVGRRLEEEAWSRTIAAQLEEIPTITRAGRPRSLTPEEIRRQEELEEEQFLMRDKLYKERLVAIGEAVRGLSTQTLDMTVEGTVHKVPAEPFIHWALGRTALRHLAPEWTAMSPTGLKMPMDDPYHSDWMLGAGFDLYKDYGHDKAVTRASLSLMFELQQKYGNYKCGVIVSGNVGTVEGRVGGEIVVLPNLSPKHLDKLKYARCIITEQGGALSHLAQVALERSVPIVHVPGAVKRYPEGHKLIVNITEGQVTDNGK
jgi:phosphohistidine swiveling domain-containing protein